MNHTSTCAQKSQAAENFSGELQPEVKSTARSESGINESPLAARLRPAVQHCHRVGQGKG